MAAEKIVYWFFALLLLIDSEMLTNQTLNFDYNVAFPRGLRCAWFLVLGIRCISSMYLDLSSDQFISDFLKNLNHIPE